MYVCICNAVTDNEIIEAQQQGYTSLEQITEHLGVGNCCGRCKPTANKLLNDNLVHKYIPQHMPTPPLAMAS